MVTAEPAGLPLGGAGGAPADLGHASFVMNIASANKTDTNFGAILVDYGPAT